MKEHNPDNDWTCPYCGAVAWEGENKLRHLAKHEPAIRKLIRRDFVQNLAVGMQSWENNDTI